MKVFILSAGLGTRLRLLTDNKPKVMIKVGEKPVLEHLINLCAHHGFRDIVINLHYLPDKITKYFGNGKRFGVNIYYSHEKDKIMGGAGGLKYAESLLKEDTFIVLNGDVMTNINLTTMLNFHKKKRGMGTFLVHKTNHPYDSDLVEYNDNLLIKRFFRPMPGDKFKPISKSGTHIFEPDVLDFIPKGREYSLEKELIPDLLKKKKNLYAYYSCAYSRDMGTPERLALIKKDYETGKITF